MTTEILDHYTRLASDPAIPYTTAMCWTVVRPLTGANALTLENVVQRLGGDPDDLEVVGLDEAMEVGANESVIHLDQVDGAVTLFENNGFQCWRSELLPALSRSSIVHAAYWTVNFDNGIRHAIDGDIVESIDVLSIDPWAAQPTSPTIDLTDIAAVRRDPSIPLQAGILAAMERATSVRLDSAWFGRPHEAIVLP